MQRRAVRIRLIDIRAEIAGIRELTANAELATFAESWGMRRAVEHGLLIIAEAAKHLPPSLRGPTRNTLGEDSRIRQPSPTRIPAYRTRNFVVDCNGPSGCARRRRGCTSRNARFGVAADLTRVATPLRAALLDLAHPAGQFPAGGGWPVLRHEASRRPASGLPAKNAGARA